MSVFESLTPQQQLLIRKHLELVIEANKTMNLTRIGDSDEGMVLHVEDSLTALGELKAAPEGFYGDLGSGAGYPGIPLAISSGRPTILIDARKRKMECVASMIDQLGLGNQVITYAGRAELYAATQSKRFAALTARALSQLPVLLELASPLLEKYGVLICYKGNVGEPELADARRVRKQVGMKLVQDRSFMLNGEYRRRILVFEKYAEPSIKLPRREGQAQKHPLSEIPTVKR